jgi:PilZ domain
MNQVMREQSFEEVAGAIATPEDRRTHDRLKLMKTMHIACPDSGLTQETGTAVDISRQGMYFTVRSLQYRIGMEIKVMIPSLGFEGVCRVVRIEELPSGYIGIGGLILGW